MPGAHVGGTHQQPPMPQHPQMFSTFQTSNRGVPPLSSKRSSYSPKDYTTAASGGVSNSVEHLFLYDGHSTTSSTGSRRSIASNSHHLRSYQQQPVANPSGRAVTQHGKLMDVLKKYDSKETIEILKTDGENANRCGIFGFYLLSFPQDEGKKYTN